MGVDSLAPATLRAHLKTSACGAARPAGTGPRATDHLAHHAVRIGDDPFSGGQRARTQRAADGAIVVAAARLTSTPRSRDRARFARLARPRGAAFRPDNPRIDGPAAQRGFVAREPRRGIGLVRPFCQFFLPIKCARVILHFGLCASGTTHLRSA